MARIRRPELPEGALNDFFVALHDLHLRSGYPSTRQIQRDIGREFVSHTTIHKAFSGPRLPGWEIVEQLVEALADRSRQDRSTVIENFRSFWRLATISPQDISATEASKVRSATQEARENIKHLTALPPIELLEGTLNEIEAVGVRKIDRELVPTGFAELDVLTGGMRAGSLIVVASRPSIGKSILLAAICASSTLKYRLPSVIFSSEMTEREMQMRFLSAEARVPYHSLRSGLMVEEEWTRLAGKITVMADAPLWLVHSARPDLAELEDNARALSIDHGIRLIAIDGLDTLIDCNQGAEETLYRLKELGADLGVPVLVTARANNSVTSNFRTRPEIDELRNADPIAGVADLVIMLDRPDAYDPESSRAGEIDLNLAKNRYGPTATVTLAFQGHYCRMVDLFISSEKYLDWSFKPPGGTAAEARQEGDEL